MEIECWTSPAGRRRLLTRLEVAEDAAYARAARLAIPGGPAGRRSYGSARGPGRPARTFPVERRAWHLRIAQVAAGASALHGADVANCYPSVGERAVHLAAQLAGGDPAALIALLRRFWAEGVTGLPIGPAASSFVADAVLAIADAAALAEGVAVVRWVDDVLFAGTRADVARAAARWAGALDDLGLAENESKRRALDLDALRVWARAPSCGAGPEGRVIIRRS